MASEANAEAESVLHDFADRLQDIYDRQTAGDYTFIGVLAHLVMRLEEIPGVTIIQKTVKPPTFPGGLTPRGNDFQ